MKTLFFGTSACVLFGLLLLKNQIGIEIQGQVDPSKPPQKAKGGGKKGTSSSRKLFQKYCVKCHGKDGKGNMASGFEVPDFTDAAWQAERTKAQLQVSILDGKGEMPSFHGKIREQQAGELADYVQSFAPVKDKPDSKPKESESDVDEQIRRLIEELDDLKRQFRELSEDSRDSRTVPSSSKTKDPASEKRKKEDENNKNDARF